MTEDKQDGAANVDATWTVEGHNAKGALAREREVIAALNEAGVPAGVPISSGVVSHFPSDRVRWLAARVRAAETSAGSSMSLHVSQPVAEAPEMVQWQQGGPADTMTEHLRASQEWQNKNRGYRVSITGVAGNMVNIKHGDGVAYAIPYGRFVDDFVLVKDAP